VSGASVDEVMRTYTKYDRLLSFTSIHHAIRAEKLLSEGGISVIALPTPREIDISCGQCLLCMVQDQATIFAILRSGQVQWSKLFRRDGKSRVYEKLAGFEEGAIDG
jgi:hypothetical protein